MKKTIFIIAMLVIGLTSFSQTTWTGATDTNWATETNWVGGDVPTATDDVIIPAAPTNQPTISATTAVCNNLTIEASATLTVTSDGKLTYSGNITVNGIIANNGEIIISTP